MRGSEPSFYGLFRRSRYGSSAHPGSEPEEEQRAMEQRERFAVAAVGFCLKHDEAFAAHFWQKVCRLPADPEDVPSLYVEVEAEHWADLRITAKTPRWSLVCVVECKAGAPLDRKQNPERPEFNEPGVGYGWFVNRSAKESGVEHRYVILGANESVNVPNDYPESHNELRVCQRGWRCLAETVPGGSLTADLFDSLGQLGISSFRMKSASQVQVRAGFGAAADAWEVLAVLGSPDMCGFRPSHWRIVGENPSPGHFNLGAYLKRPPEKRETSNLHIELSKMLNPPGDEIVWIGYETGPSVKPDGFRRSIWFYCADSASAKSMLRRLEKEFSDCYSFTDENCAVLSTAKGNVKDLEWFESKLNSVVR